ncbi:MAG: hypothetical protein JST75_20850 [Bacteroidetes bacterium]|nr:hypothetical protein [Bacteroidota bacterium]
MAWFFTIYFKQLRTLLISFSKKVGDNAFLQIIFQVRSNISKIDYSGNGFIISGIDEEPGTGNPNFSFCFSRNVDGWDRIFPVTVFTESEFISSFLDEIGDIIISGIKEYEGYHQMKISILHE